MMVYGLTLFVPQLVFEVVVLIQLFVASHSLATTKRLSNPISLFILSFTAIVISNFVL